MWHTLFVIICLIESGNNPSAIGDGGKAVGIVQIHPIVVQEVNRIGRTNYTLADRLDPVKSEEMFSIYMDYMSKRLNTTDPVTLARCWNGGPQGHRKKATLEYGEKVRRHLTND